MHIKYINKNHKEVPSVTTILGVLNKSGLIEWANLIGKKGIDYKKFLEERALIGTYTHLMIESFLLNTEKPLIGSQKLLQEAESICNKFKSSIKDFPISNIITEKSLAGEKFGGTLDIICDMNIDGETVKVLGDFKTSKSAFESHFIQLGGYLALIKELDKELYDEIKYCMILVVNKDKVIIKWITKENCEKYFSSIFLSLLVVYEELKKFKSDMESKNIFFSKKY